MIHAGTQRIWEAAEQGVNYANNPKISRHDCVTVFSYMNGIAIGVEEGISSAHIVQDHMPNTIIKVVGVIMPAVLANAGGYEALIRRRDSWKAKGVSYRH